MNDLILTFLYSYRTVTVGLYVHVNSGGQGTKNKIGKNHNLSVSLEL